MIDQLLEGNLEFVANEYRPNSEYYQTVAAKQTPKVLWSAAPTPRVSEHQMTGLKRGTMFVTDRIAAERNLSREEKLEVLTAENVKLQIKHLKNLVLIKNQHAKGKIPRIHGGLYRVESGTIDVLVDGRKDEAKA